MSRFVVAYLSFFDNKIRMEIINANSFIEALKEGVYLFENWEVPDNWTEEEIETAIENSDATISVMEI